MFGGLERIWRKALEHEVRADIEALRGRAVEADLKRVQAALKGAKSEQALAELGRTLAELRFALTVAEAQRAGEAPPERREPCFFDPQHGVSATDVLWSPTDDPETAEPVPVCAEDADRIEHGAAPQIRTVKATGSLQPYWAGEPSQVAYFSGAFRDPRLRALVTRKLDEVDRFLDADLSGVVSTAVREQLDAFGADLLQQSTGVGFDHEARAEHDRAAAALERARAAFDVDELQRVGEAMAEALHAFAAVEVRLAGEPPPEQRPLCFFDPHHGPSATEVTWAPPGAGLTRRLPACAGDAARLQRGEAPRILRIVGVVERVPYWTVGHEYRQYARGLFPDPPVSELVECGWYGRRDGTV